MSGLVRIGWIVSAITLVFTPSAIAQGVFHGLVDSELVAPDSGLTLTLCKRAAQEEGQMTAPHGKVFACVASWPLRQGQLEIPMRLVEVDGARYPVLLVDANRDGVFADNERFAFRRKRHRYARAEVRLTLPTPGGSAFERFPVVAMIPKESLEPPLVPPSAADERYLFYSLMLFATARISIDDRTVFFRHSVTADADEVDLRGSMQSVDRGILDGNRLSPHRASGRGREIPVFRLERRYVSIERFDLRQRVAAVRERQATEYRRLELHRGLTVPDFGLTNVTGEVRRLSELRNRHVLVFFWYGGCVPCRGELKNVTAVRQTLGPENLAIVGFSDGNTTAEQLAALLAPAGPFDVHADVASARTLMHEWFNISSLPTLILLDGEGRIVSINQEYRGRHALRGPALLPTLRSILKR